MKVLCTLSPTAALDFMTKPWVAQSTNINIAWPAEYNVYGYISQ